MQPIPNPTEERRKMTPLMISACHGPEDATNRLKRSARDPDAVF